MRFGGENEPKSLEPVGPGDYDRSGALAFQFLDVSYYPKLLIGLRVWPIRNVAVVMMTTITSSMTADGDR
jgi:hypothetical protein